MPLTIDDISANHCDNFLHCKMCLEELPQGVAPRDWARIEFGSYHKDGEPGIYLQLWCVRHDCNITTIHVGTEQWEHDDRLPLRVADAVPPAEVE